MNKENVVIVDFERRARVTSPLEELLYFQKTRDTAQLNRQRMEAALQRQPGLDTFRTCVELIEELYFFNFYAGGNQDDRIAEYVGTIEAYQQLFSDEQWADIERVAAQRLAQQDPNYHTNTNSGTAEIYS